jgi:hypothetical protein
MLTEGVTTPSDRPSITLSGVGVEITNDKNLQPGKNILLTLSYRDQDVSRLNQDRLIIAYYDDAHSRWLTVPSTSYPGQKKVTGTIRHLSKFAIVQLGPSPDLSRVKAYPVPFNPVQEALTIDNLTESAMIRIFDVTGQLIGTIPYSTADGRAFWDGTNSGGRRVASGVYLLDINSPQGRKIIKIAVEK